MNRTNRRNRDDGRKEDEKERVKIHGSIKEVEKGDEPRKGEGEQERRGRVMNGKEK